MRDNRPFWDKVEQAGECWVWQGALNTKGYGHFTFNKQRWLVHRYVYERLVGSIPKDLTIDHLCRNRRCVNPNHLEAVTLHVNLLRGTGRAAENARKIVCIRGHPFDRRQANGRDCFECRKIRKLARKAARAQTV